VHSVLLILILYSVLLMYYFLRIVHFYVMLPPGIGSIAVGNKYEYNIIIYNLFKLFISNQNYIRFYKIICCDSV
jgi:hypothetical protein